MGHLEPGGEAGSAAALSDPLWPLWRQVAGQFTLVRMLTSGLGSRAGWGLHTVDFVSSLRRTPMARGAFALLDGVPAAELARLAELAEVNSRRNEALWRVIVVLYVTVPVTGLLVGLQAAPELVLRVIAEGSTLLWAVFLSMGLSMIYYLATLWRARQITAVLELVRLERSAPGLQS